MPDTFTLNPTDDDQQLLAQVVEFYHATLKNDEAALAYLKTRGINSTVIDYFRIGHADRTLGLKLPSKDSKAGRAIRSRLEALGLFRESGHEQFVGCIVFPIAAGDGSYQIKDIYGHKLLGKRLRKGTPLDLHLNDKNLGVWNIEGFAGRQEIVVCSSLWDALAFWTQGYRNVTCSFTDTISDDLRAGFTEFNIRRVVTTNEKLVQPLLDLGLEAFTLRLPLGICVEAYAAQKSDRADALGSLLRAAEWSGKGKQPAPVVVPTVTPEAHNDDSAEQLEEVAAPTSSEALPPSREASPSPSLPQEIEAEVGTDEVNIIFGNRKYRVRGHAKNVAFDVMKVNVLVNNDSGMFIDTFDLYAAKHRRAFTTQAAEELRVEEATIKNDIGRVLLKLEELQDLRQREVEKIASTLPEMTPEERDEALALLRDPKLLDRIVSDFSVVGERTNKLVGYLAVVSRKLDQPLAVLIQSTSAAGKTTLMEAVLNFCPPEDMVKFSSMTGQSLYYMGPDALRHKILAIVEEEGAAKASYALKLLQSEGELRIASTGKESTSGRLVTQEYRVEGPVMLFLTTTSSSVDEELLNRCIVLTVNEDRDQTRAIHQLQRARHTLTGLLTSHDHANTIKLHRNAQRLLRPLLVANPFAERLTFMDTTTRTRRDNMKYLTLIRTITLLRQHQRPVKTTEHHGKPVEYIEVTLEDIATANRLSAEVFGRTLDDLPPQTRRLLDLIDGMVDERCKAQGVERADVRFTARDVREHTSWGETQLKVHMKRLVDLEYLLVHRDRHSKRFMYELLFTKPVAADEKTLAGLIDVAVLRDAQRSGCGSSTAG